MKKLKYIFAVLLILPVFALAGCFAVKENHDFDAQNNLVTHSAESNNILSHFLEERFEGETLQNQRVYTKVNDSIKQINSYFSMFLMMNLMIEAYEKTGVTTTLRKDGEVYKYQSDDSKISLDRTQEKFVLDIVADEQVEQLVIDFASNMDGYEGKLTRGEGIVFVVDIFSIENGYAFQISIYNEGMYSVSQGKYTAGDGEIKTFNLFVYESQVLPFSIFEGVPDNFASGQGSISYSK